MPDPAVYTNQNTDIFGFGENVIALPHIGVETSANPMDFFQNAFDETQGIEKYMNEKITMEVPVLDKVVTTCEDNCKEKNRVADQKCALFRKRVEAAMKKAGCPTKLTAIKRPGGCNRAAPKKKTTTAKPKRG